MKKYLVIICVLALCFTSCNKHKEIITTNELVEGVWVSAMLYSESIDAYIPIVEKETMLGFVFYKNGTCQLGFGNGDTSEIKTFSLNNNHLVLHGTNKDINIEIEDYSNDYLQVVIKADGYPIGMRCKLKKLTND